MFAHPADKVSNIARLNLIIFSILFTASERSFMQILRKLELAKVLACGRNDLRLSSQI